MSDVSLDRGAATRDRWRLFLDRGVLGVFLVAGSLSVIALKIVPVPFYVRVGVPIAVILLYAALTLSRTRFRLRFDQAGDNCYYMGFIFTLVSLGVALYRIQSGISQEIGLSIVRDFGLALSTTVVGIICRVSLTQLREDPHDIEEATRRELIEYSRALSGQMRASVGMIADFRQETEDRLKNFVFEVTQVVKEHQARVGELREAAQRLSDSTKTLAEDFSAAESSTGSLRQGIGVAVANINLLAVSLRDMNQMLHQTGASANTAAENYLSQAAASKSVADGELQLSQVLAGTVERLGKLSEAVGALSTTFGPALESGEAFGGLTAEVRNVTEALRTATRSVAGSNSRLVAAEASLAAQLDTTERAARGLLAALETLEATRANMAAETASGAGDPRPGT
ncbi:MAG: hypothetical protein LCH95_08930 [Proteobacteria bacterium]|nr:hypothetical protein [Pseudomonadota bacterium]